MKIQARSWETMYAKPRSDKDLVSEMFEIPELGSKVNSPMKYGQGLNTFDPRRYTNGREACERVFNTGNHWRNTACSQNGATHQTCP